MKNGFEETLDQFEDIILRSELEHNPYDNSDLIKGQVFFINGWRLEFMEFESVKKHKYRFHLMDEENKMVVRWDTAPHYPELDNFPFHKHSRDDVESTPEFSGEQLLREICQKVVENV